MHGWSVILCEGKKERPRLFICVNAFLCWACAALFDPLTVRWWLLGAAYFGVVVYRAWQYMREDARRLRA